MAAGAECTCCKRNDFHGPLTQGVCGICVVMWVDKNETTGKMEIPPPSTPPRKIRSRTPHTPNAPGRESSKPTPPDTQVDTFHGTPPTKRPCEDEDEEVPPLKRLCFTDDDVLPSGDADGHQLHPLPDPLVAIPPDMQAGTQPGTPRGQIREGTPPTPPAPARGYHGV